MTKSQSDLARNATRGRITLLAVGALAAASVPCLSWGQGRMLSERERAPAALAVEEGSVFKCEGGRDLKAQFSSRDSNIVAIVDAGDGPHALQLRPWVTGNVPEITWSDGQRTLTWNVGVQLMFMDGGKHLSCGRGEHAHEGHG